MKKQFRIVINRFPLLKRLFKLSLQFILLSRDVSTDYVELNDKDVEKESSRLQMAWKNIDLPERQRELVDRQLADFARGEQVDVFDVMVKCMRRLQVEACKMRVLEVGCSSGYYSEVFEIANFDLEYTGCDYSDAFISMARHRYPKLSFDIQDATALSYSEKSFDVVISGCCLLHIPDYNLAIAETARVSNRFTIFHRTPVVIGAPNTYYRKRAYGVETIEIHFNEPDFLQLLVNNGLDLIETYTLSETATNGVGFASRTYLCCKKVV